MNLTLSDVISITAVMQIVIFVIFLLKKKNFHTSNYLLAIFLIIQAILFFNFLTGHLYSYTIRYAPHTLLTGVPFFWLVAPTLHLYVLSICRSGFQLKKIHLLHALPFLVDVSGFMILFYLKSAAEKQSILTSGSGLGRSFFWYAHCAAFYIQFLIYNILSLHTIAGYRKQVKDNYSSL